MKLLLISFGIVLADQISKLYVKGFNIPFLNFSHSGLPYGRKTPLIDHVLHLSFVENPGIAFGIDFGEEFKLLISILTIIASFSLLIYFFFVSKENIGQRLSLALIIGGAFGNLIDRVFYGVFYGYAPLLQGKVVDFFDVSFFRFYFFNKTMGNYIFNVADVAVTLGVLMLIFSYHRKQKPSSSEIRNEDKILAEPGE